MKRTYTPILRICIILNRSHLLKGTNILLIHLQIQFLEPKYTIDYSLVRVRWQQQDFF
jgi:hypothetical protein